MLNNPKIHPAVLIGGPPHAGKSTLTYSLTRALRRYGVPHYVLRACPDGEGHWSHEAPRQVAEKIRRKGTFSDTFIQRVCADIERRQLPFLVDVGGLPQGEQLRIFHFCTDAILLCHPTPFSQVSESASTHDVTRPPALGNPHLCGTRNQALEPGASERRSWLRFNGTPAAIDWHALVAEHHLNILADLVSDLHGTSHLNEREPILKGTLAGLQRGTTIQGEPFESLVACLIALFAATTDGLSEAHRSMAPTELVLNLPQILDSLAPGSMDWKPELLPHLLEIVPPDIAFSAYGRAPHWVYSTLCTHASASFFQFDVRLGWLQPLLLRFGTRSHPEITFETENREDFTLFSCSLHNQNLDYAQLGGLNVPVLPLEKGLILSGKLPLWLSSALSHFYQLVGLPWIAGYYPQLHGAVVIHSRDARYAPGDLIPLALPERV